MRRAKSPSKSTPNALLLSLSLLIACSTSPLECPERDTPEHCDAIQTAWHALGGEPAEPPRIEWRDELWLDGVRYAGLFYGTHWIAYVAQQPEQCVWATALVHELLHASQWQRGVEDAEHTLTDEWRLADEIQQGHEVSCP